MLNTTTQPNNQRLSIIAAVGENCELGKKNDLIWRIKADLQRVKELTTGHPIIMGQNTYESIGKPLPDRTNVVLTQDPAYAPAGCVMAYSLEEALTKARETGSNEAFIFGGAYVYAQTIDLVDRLYLTLIHDTDPEADVFFPEYTQFSKVIDIVTGEQDGLIYEWLTLERE